LLEKPFGQVLSLNQKMPKLVLLRSSHFTAERGQIVGQKVPQSSGFGVG
jgi:hypothetical protein